MKKEKTIGLIGIGIFLCLSLQEISFLLSKLIERTLLLTKMPPMFLYGVSNYLMVGIILLFFLLILRKLKKSDFDDPKTLKRTFIFWVVAFIAGQLLEFGYPFLLQSLETPAYTSNWLSYYDELNKQPLLKELYVDVPAFTLRYGLMVVIVMRQINTVREK